MFLLLLLDNVSAILTGDERTIELCEALSAEIFEGTGKARLVGKYQPLFSRPTMNSLEELNARYAARAKGQRRQAVRTGAASSG